CCRELRGLEPRTFVSPLPADAEDVRRAAATPACDAALAEIEEGVGDRLVVARVDRIELSKNLVRGFLAFDLLLEQHPEWRGRVVFLASVYPSRTGVPAYIEYQQDVEATVQRVNERWATGDWTPIVYDTRDDYPRSLAVLRRADAVLVNPIRDGLNLVAKEAAIVNERDAVLCLSPEAGVWDELSEAVLAVSPYDLVSTAAALDEALRMPAARRAELARRLRALSTARAPRDWLADQLAAAGCPRRRPGRRAQWAARRRRTSSTPVGPSTSRSARATSSSGASSPATATRRTVTPARARRSRASKAGRSPWSSPM